MPGEPSASQPGRKPFVGLHLRCCNVYVRAYPNADQSAFVARCPRCGAPVKIDVVDEGGATGQFFAAS